MKRYFFRNRRNFGQNNLGKATGEKFDFFLATLTAALIGFSGGASTAVKLTIDHLDRKREKIVNSESDVLAKVLKIVGTGVAVTLTAGMLVWQLKLNTEAKQLEIDDAKAKQLEIDIKTKPSNRADIWFTKLGGTREDLTNYNTEFQLLEDIKSKYGSQFTQIMEDLKRIGEDTQRYLSEVNEGSKAFERILLAGLGKFEYRQGLNVFAALMVYAFADSNGMLTEEKEAKAFFVYQKIATSMLWIFDKIKHEHNSLSESRLANIIALGLVDSFGILYAIPAWDQIISRSPEQQDDRNEFFWKSLCAAANAYIYETKIGRINDGTNLSSFKDINFENSRMYIRIFKKMFPSD
ncbi:MAG: hypothetical protein LBK29_02385 [Oscillospiraceae bacterium]|jgi:hypothetical protein|nr:hypothetical protein [Oscillospiraceae bacterium]